MVALQSHFHKAGQHSSSLEERVVCTLKEVLLFLGGVSFASPSTSGQGREMHA